MAESDAGHADSAHRCHERAPAGCKYAACQSIATVVFEEDAAVALLGDIKFEFEDASRGEC